MVVDPPTPPDVWRALVPVSFLFLFLVALLLRGRPLPRTPAGGPSVLSPGSGRYIALSRSGPSGLS
jgi:hypothetical protein